MQQQQNPSPTQQPRALGSERGPIPLPVAELAKVSGAGPNGGWCGPNGGWAVALV